MSNYTRNMKQQVTYWAPTARDAYGKITFASPVVFNARWEDHTDVYRDKSGQEFISKARIFCPQPIALDGYLYLGTSAATDPTTLPAAQPIQLVGQIPDLRNLTQLNSAIVK